MAGWLNYHHLLYFREIASEGSIAAAAQKLKLSPSALSMQLKNLEETLGHPVFERRSKKLFLTDFGRHALEYAERIHRLGDELVQTVNNASFSDKALFRLGVMSGLPKSMIVEIVQKLRTNFPESPFSISEGNFLDLKQDLLNHEIDVLFANYAPVDQSDLFYVKNFKKSPISLYGTEKFLPLKENFPKSLEGQSVVLPNKQSKMRTSVEYWFQKFNLHYELSAEVQDSSLKKYLAHAGLGLVPLPEFAAEQFVKEGKLFQIGRLEGVFEEYFLIMTKRILKVPAADFLTKNLS
ncbi:MAG: LysR family transcriptional regulator [Bacteriovoracaceae bacterium]|nr:LysR family transcriptional regulator [Bacteriovoracaceae bacterium]